MDVNMDDLTEVARKAALAYKKKDTSEGRKAWGVDQYMTGLVGDVGDLSKLIMARSGYRKTENVDARIEHELADCLWGLLAIADGLNIDLATAYRKNMDSVLQRVR
jgi:NTP pyrophosphatase (non-canonical NTP hydrolase)